MYTRNTILNSLMSSTDVSAAYPYDFVHQVLKNPSSRRFQTRNITKETKNQASTPAIFK